MQRILLLLFLLVLAVWAASRSLTRLRRSPLGRQLVTLYRVLNGMPPGETAERGSNPAAGGTAKTGPTELRKCDLCGSYVPRERGVKEGSTFRCEKCERA